MGREQMRNLDTSRIGGAQVNEFEYQKNQGELTEQLEQHPSGAQGRRRRLTQAERVKQIMAAAHKKVEKKKKREAASGPERKSRRLSRPPRVRKKAPSAKNAPRKKSIPAEQYRNLKPSPGVPQLTLPILSLAVASADWQRCLVGLC